MLDIFFICCWKGWKVSVSVLSVKFIKYMSLVKIERMHIQNDQEASNCLLSDYSFNIDILKWKSGVAIAKVLLFCFTRLYKDGKLVVLASTGHTMNMLQALGKHQENFGWASSCCVSFLYF